VYIFSHGTCQLHQKTVPKITILEVHIVFFSNAIMHRHQRFALQTAAHIGWKQDWSCSDGQA
jgi:hypothetical protein